MGDLLGKFPKRRASEDKARQKRLGLAYGDSRRSDKQPLHVNSKITDFWTIIKRVS